MAQVIDMSQFTFNVEQIRSISELLFDEVVNSPEIKRLLTFYPGIVFKKEIGFIGKGGLVGVAGQGCDPEPQDWQINTSKVTWEPADWEILLHMCYKDLEPAAAVYSLETGIRRPDFTESDYMNIVLRVLREAVKEFMVRLFWFSDTDAANVSGSGEIKNGVDVKYFNIIDGLFKQMMEQVTANASQRVTITENAGASYAAQALDPENVQGYLSQLIYAADLVVRSKQDAKIFCTQSVYDAYRQSLAGTALETMYRNMVDGQAALRFDGYELVPVPMWDEIIRSYFDNGTKWVNPHRAVFTTRDFLAAGVDAEDSFEDMRIWYDQNDRKVKVEMMGLADAKLLDPAKFSIAI